MDEKYDSVSKNFFDPCDKTENQNLKKFRFVRGVRDKRLYTYYTEGTSIFLLTRDWFEGV